jgi:hypothetical protein
MGFKIHGKSFLEISLELSHGLCEHALSLGTLLGHQGLLAKRHAGGAPITPAIDNRGALLVSGIPSFKKFVVKLERFNDFLG